MIEIKRKVKIDSKLLLRSIVVIFLVIASPTAFAKDLDDKKWIKALRRVGKGTGKVMGKFPGKSTYPYKDLDQEIPTKKWEIGTPPKVGGYQKRPLFRGS